MLSTEPILSICIPTWNRASCLRRLLQRVAPQVARAPAGSIEIFVRNNASPDHTEAVLAEFAAVIPCLRYTTTAVNEGFDVNCLEVVRQARGTFCWLMGDDDAPADNGLQTVLADVAGGNGDLWIYDRVECSPDFVPERVRHWSIVPDGTRVHGASVAEIRSYLGSCRNVGALFNCLSCLVVRRSAWELPEVPDPFTHVYIHVFCCWQVLARKGILTVRHATPVHCRVIEEQVVRDTGVLNRLALDLNGYRLLAELAGRRYPELVRDVLAAFRRGRSLSNLLRAAVNANAENRRAEFFRLLRGCGYSWLFLQLLRFPRLPLLLHPIWLAALTPFRRIRNRRRLARTLGSRFNPASGAP